MNQSVIGYFDSKAMARSAIEKIEAAGFPAGSARLSGDTPYDVSTASSGSPAPTEADAGAGLLSGIRHFLSDVFGDSHERIDDYEEGVKRGGCIVKVSATSDDELTRAADILEAAGAVDIDERAIEWRKLPTTPADAAIASTTSTTSTTSTAWADDPAGSIASELSSTRADGALIDSPTRAASSDSASVFPGNDDYVDTYRSDYDTRYSSLGGSFDDYEPAYRYGHDIANDQSYTGRDWDDLEPTLKNDWSTKNPDSPWEKVKEGIKHAWHVARG